MKILYFTPFYPPQSEAAATRSFWFVKALRDDGHQVKIIKGSDLINKLASNTDRAITRLIRENLSGIELFLRVLCASEERIILSSPPFFTVMWGALGAYFRRIPYILDVRDLYPEVFFEMNLLKEQSFLGRCSIACTKFIYSKALNIITVTNGLVKEIQKRGVGNVHLIMNGYDSELFYSGKAEEKFEKFTLLFHGNLGKVQNMDTLLRLAKSLENESDIQIIVAGAGPKAKDIIQANRSNIKYLGNIPYQEIPALVRKSHVGLSFRTDDKIGKEAFPVKVFEYIGSGIPTIMSPKGEAGQLIETENFGKEFENSEIEAMTTEILRYKNEKIQIQKDNLLSRQVSSKKILNLI